jgi:hypothetical protein
MTWRSVDTAPMDGGTLLLTVLYKGKPVVTLCGYDPSWSGKTWVYPDVRIPVGTQPIAWKPVDAPADPAQFPVVEGTH